MMTITICTMNFAIISRIPIALTNRYISPISTRRENSRAERKPANSFHTTAAFQLRLLKTKRLLVTNAKSTAAIQESALAIR